MVDRIPTPNTSSVVSRVSNIGGQTRPQDNNLSNRNSPSTDNKPLNNSPLNKTVAASNAPTGPASNTSSSAANVASIIKVIRQLSPNQNLTAQVTSSQALNKSEQALLQRINPSLVQQLKVQDLKVQPLKTQQLTQQSNQASANLGAGNLSLSKLSTNALTGNTTLYLTKLAINTTTNINALINSKTLTTITNQAFSTDQTLILGQQNGQLQINANNQSQLNLQERLQQAASQSIKNILPKQESVSQLQQFTGQLSQVITKLPPNLQAKLAGGQVIQALNELNRFTQTNISLQQGRQVQQALANSGTSFEAKLTQSNNLPTNYNALTRSSTLQSNLQSNLQIKLQPNLQQDIRTTLDKILTAINTSEVPSRLNNLSAALNQTDIDKLIAAIIATQNTSASPTVNNISIPKNLTAATAAVFRLLGIQIPLDAQIVAQLPKAIEQHLKKLIEQTHAKIQFNQLRSIGLDQPSSETRSNLQQFHTELPLRFNEQILPLQLSIHEQEIEKERYKDEDAEKNNDDEQSSTRRWQVFLSFDLPSNEKLHTQLTIIESSISATLWAESASLCYKAQQDISWLRDKLLANGLTVEDIICLQGRPQQKEVSLDYNLVDIKT